MALARIQSVSTYSSASGGVTYWFDIVVAQNGNVSIRNIRGPKGLLDSNSDIPQSVLDDMVAAKAIVLQTQAESAVLSGTLTFTGETYQDVVIAGGILNNSNYRVVFSTDDGTVVYAENLTTTGFRTSVATAYGSISVPKIVGYTVLAAAQQASTTSGTVTITDSDNSMATVAFSTAMLTSDYRVVLSLDGLYPAYVGGKTKTGFTISVGYTFQNAEIRTIGYDVFV